MAITMSSNRTLLTSCLVLLSVLIPPLYCDTPTLSDIFKLTTPDANINQQTRTARDNNSKYFLSRYAGAERAPDERSRSLKPEENSGTVGGSAESTSTLEKRCTRCDEDRYRQYNDRYDPHRTSNQYYDRYYEQSRYRDDPYEKYDRYERDRYDPYEYENRYYDQRRDRDRDGGLYDRQNVRDQYDRYDRNRGYEPRGDRYNDRYHDRGVGYDNRGYDNRGVMDYRGGSSGYGGNRPSAYDDQYSRDRVQDRNYYKPQEGGYYGGNYASSWNYGGANRNDDYYGRDKYDRNNPKPTDPATESRYYGYGNQYRPRDPYDQYAYRGTSYLYGRPSSTTTLRPPGGDDANSVTDSSKPNSQG